MSTGGCLTMPSNDSLRSPSFQSNSISPNHGEDHQRDEKENYSLIYNQYLSSTTYANKSLVSTRLAPEANPQLLRREEAKLVEMNQDKLLLPCSTRSLKRRTSLLERSRDWVSRPNACARGTASVFSVALPCPGETSDDSSPISTKHDVQ